MAETLLDRIVSLLEKDYRNERIKFLHNKMTLDAIFAISREIYNHFDFSL